MSVYLWHVPSLVLLTGVQLLWLTRPIVVAVVLLVRAISIGTKRWESPKPILEPRWPSASTTATAVGLFIVESLAISAYGLDLNLAVIALRCTGAAVVLTSGRDRFGSVHLRRRNLHQRRGGTEVSASPASVRSSERPAI